jgi:hypothetical protein
LSWPDCAKFPNHLGENAQCRSHNPASTLGTYLAVCVNSGSSIWLRRSSCSGGFGTIDELFEALTLIQTRKPRKSMPVVLFGTEFWDEVLDFGALERWGLVSLDDLRIFYKTDSVDGAFEYLKRRLEELYLIPAGLEQIKLA